MNILLTKHFVVGFMVSEIPRDSVFGHCLYSVTFPYIYVYLYMYIYPSIYIYIYIYIYRIGWIILDIISICMIIYVNKLSYNIMNSQNK